MRSPIIFAVTAFAIVNVGGLQHDNLIIAVGDHLEFLSDGNTYRQLTLNSYNASKLSALAYDATTRKLFFSDVRHRYGHIFSVNLDNESHHPVEDIVEKNNNETVDSLAYDPVNQMLMWTDGTNRAIRRVHIDNNNNKSPIHIQEKDGLEIVHFLENDDKPRGLVSDPCTRMMYWTNIHDSLSTIERSFLNGSHREIVVHSDLLLPNAFDVDMMEQMIYWAEDLRNGYFRIERSYVNGTGRQEFHRGMGNFIVSLTVGDDFVYWTDYSHKKLWSLRKDGSSKSPVILRTFRNPAMDVVVLRHQPFNCSLVEIQAHHVANNRADETLTIILTTMAFLLVVIMTVLLVIRLKGRTESPLFMSNKKEGTFAFQNFENCPEKVYTPCERAI